MGCLLSPAIDIPLHPFASGTPLLVVGIGRYGDAVFRALVALSSTSVMRQPHPVDFVGFWSMSVGDGDGGLRCRRGNGGCRVVILIIASSSRVVVVINRRSRRVGHDWSSWWSLCKRWALCGVQNC